MSTAQPDTGTTTEERTTPVPTHHGDHDRFAHIVAKDKVADAMVFGTPLEALCGKRWVPSRAPDGYPVCPDCLELYKQGMRPK